MRGLSFCILLLCATLQALTFESSHIKDALPYVETGSLVVVDLDNTMITPPQMLGTSEWAYHLRHHLIDEGMEPAKAEEEVFQRWCFVQKITRIVTMEGKDTLEFVRSLQKKGICLMAQTKRLSCTAKVTQRQLKMVGLDFCPTAPCRASKRIPMRCGPPPLYARGVLYDCNEDQKGPVLESYLRHIGYRPRRIVFIDDRLKNIESVAEACKRMDIDYVGLHYLGSKKKEEAFDFEVAEVQWKTLGKILTNDQARKIAEN